jgi:drug/metabolite transporter (DMT)-like permease
MQNNKNQQSLFFVYTALLCAAFFWGSSFPATKIVLQGFTPVAYVFLRFLGAAIIFGLLMVRRYRRLPKSVHFKLILMAFFQPTLYFLFESAGLQFTSASSASMIIAGIPGVVALLAGFFLKERLNARQWAGVLLSIAGVILLAGFDDNPTYTDSSLLGNGLVILAALSASLYMIVARHLSADLSAVELTFYQVFYGMLLLLPVFLIRISAVPWQQINLPAIGALVFLILGATLVAFLAYNFALTRIDASKAAVFLNGVPLSAILVSWVLLGERLGLLQFAGGFIVILGVTLTNWRARTAGRRKILH